MNPISGILSGTSVGMKPPSWVITLHRLVVHHCSTALENRTAVSRITQESSAAVNPGTNQASHRPTLHRRVLRRVGQDTGSPALDADSGRFPRHPRGLSDGWKPLCA